MEIHSYTAWGSIDATIEGVRMEVPDDMGNRYRQMIDAWEFETDEEGNRTRVNTIPPYVAPTPGNAIAPLSLQQVGAARLLVQDWEVTGVEQSQGIAGAFLLDVDLALVLFHEEFPDTEYIVMPPEGITKYPGYVEVSRPGLSSISFIIMRVQ